MIETKLLDDLARRLAAAMPRSLTAFQQDIEKNLRAGLETMFQRLDLVTREEYEVQVALLARSREKLAILEARLAELENRAKLLGMAPRKMFPQPAHAPTTSSASVDVRRHRTGRRRQETARRALALIGVRDPDAVGSSTRPRFAVHAALPWPQTSASRSRVAPPPLWPSSSAMQRGPPARRSQACRR